jgi:hypothetical protein
MEVLIQASQKDDPHRQGNEGGDTDGEKRQKKFAHQTVVDASGT